MKQVAADIGMTLGTKKCARVHTVNGVVVEHDRGGPLEVSKQTEKLSVT